MNISPLAPCSVTAKVGCYHFDGNHIIHAKSQTKAEFKERPQEWEFQKNWSPKGARLFNNQTMMSQPVYKIFERQHIGIPQENTFSWDDVSWKPTRAPKEAKNTNVATSSKAKAQPPQPPSSNLPGRRPRARFMGAADEGGTDTEEAHLFQ